VINRAFSGRSRRWCSVPIDEDSPLTCPVPTPEEHAIQAERVRVAEQAYIAQALPPLNLPWTPSPFVGDHDRDEDLLRLVQERFRSTLLRHVGGEGGRALSLDAM
jgi:hypothetical protein